MPPLIENPTDVELTSDVTRVLHKIFSKYQKIIIKKEFGGGLSGGRVFEVRPVRSDGAPELPTVVKLAPVSLIQQEWHAYRRHVQNRLPRVATLTAGPVLLHEAGLGGLRYAMSGDGAFEIVSLYDYYRQMETSADKLTTTLNQLFRVMGHIWSYHSVYDQFHLRASYDQVLPVNLLIDYSPIMSEPVPAVTPIDGSVDRFQPGDQVCLAGFSIHKVNPETQTMTLKSPRASYARPNYFMRCRLPMNTVATGLAANQVMHAVAGEVLETRFSRLYREISRAFGGQIDPTAAWITVAEGAALPNPVSALPRLLNVTRPVHIATIHGDFNLGNILIEPETGAVSLIDFADAREDHVLHDFLRMETEVITRLIPAILQQQDLDPAPIIAWLYWHLHQMMLNPLAIPPRLPHADLQKPFAMLRTLRGAARHYLCSAGDIGEYYQGLTFYLLGALKFKNLDHVPEAPLPKQSAFWGAAIVYALLTNGAEASTQPPPALAALLARLPVPVPTTTGHAEALPAETSARQRLQALPISTIAPLGTLPIPSRMPFNRNPLFVGRTAQLKQIAAAFRPEAEFLTTPNGMGPRTVVISGLGGIGKTQLATEFVHRYGRFFAGGVFWLSFVDSRAIPTEIAACGGVNGLALRPNFDELPLEEQGRLVQAAWQSPLPRLLIFDNCEDPELLARWRPIEGGCSILVTSRRADWQEWSGIESVALQVLSRTESVALLREHRPDAPTTVLHDLAEEVGDLPLALHLMGSFLVRYRHTIEPAAYLAQLRKPSLLHHRSLQSGSQSPTDHDQHVSRTIGISFNCLQPTEEADAAARRVLAHAACLAPGEPIALSVLLLAMGAAPTDLVVQSQVETAIKRLLELGLVRWEKQQLRLHRLVMAFVQTALTAEIEQLRPTLERALCTEAERLNEAGYPAALLPWQAHLRTLVNAVYYQGRQDELGIKLCRVMGEHFRQIGDYERARLCLIYVAQVQEAVWGANHKLTAQSLTEVGLITLLQGNLSSSATYLERALTIQEATIGDHPDTANTLNVLGYLLQHQNDLEAAQACHERALAIRCKTLGSDHTLVAHSLCNLAYIAYRRQHFADARTYLEQALAVQQKVWGEQHVETARVLANLGDLLQAQGELDAAEAVLHKALTILQKELGEEHPEIALVLQYLGMIYQTRADITGARTHYERAHQIFQAHHGADHFRTRRVQENLKALPAYDSS